MKEIPEKTNADTRNAAGEPHRGLILACKNKIFAGITLYDDGENAIFVTDHMFFLGEVSLYVLIERHHRKKVLWFDDFYEYARVIADAGVGPGCGFVDDSDQQDWSHLIRFSDSEMAQVCYMIAGEEGGPYKKHNALALIQQWPEAARGLIDAIRDAGGETAHHVRLMRRRKKNIGKSYLNQLEGGNGYGIAHVLRYDAESDRYRIAHYHEDNSLSIGNNWVDAPKADHAIADKYLQGRLDEIKKILKEVNPPAAAFNGSIPF
jgi:hypothetical protein